MEMSYTERGEIILDIYPESVTGLEKLSRWISVDRISGDGYRIYANSRGFDKILSQGVPFRIIDVRRNVPNVKVYEGGIDEWEEYNLPVEEC